MCEYSVDVRIFHGLLARSCGTAPSFVDPSSVVPSDILLRKPDSDVLLLRSSVTPTDKRFEKCVWCCSQNEFHHFALSAYLFYMKGELYVCFSRCYLYICFYFQYRNHPQYGVSQLLYNLFTARKFAIIKKLLTNYLG